MRKLRSAGPLAAVCLVQGGGSVPRGQGGCAWAPHRENVELEGRGRFPVDALAALPRVGRLCEEPLLLWRYGQEVEAIKPKIERRREFRGTWRSYMASV